MAKQILTSILLVTTLLFPCYGNCSCCKKSAEQAKTETKNSCCCDKMSDQAPVKESSSSSEKNCDISCCDQQPFILGAQVSVKVAPTYLILQMPAQHLKSNIPVTSVVSVFSNPPPLQDICLQTCSMIC
jgi:hypothetical protein